MFFDYLRTLTKFQLRKCSKTRTKPYIWQQNPCFAYLPQGRAPPPNSTSERLGPQNVNGRRLGLPNSCVEAYSMLLAHNCLSVAIFTSPEQSSDFCYILVTWKPTMRIFRYPHWSPTRNCALNKAKIQQEALDIERQRQTQEIKRTLRSNLDVQDLP